MGFRRPLPDPCLLPKQRQRVLCCYDGFAVVHTTIVTLEQHVDPPPDRVQKTREREVEESQDEVFRRRVGHEPLDRLH